MKTNLPSKLTAAACLGLGLACLCAVASAADEPVPTHVVRYADLDISHEAGARTLYRRIEAAAREVCHVDFYSYRRLPGNDQQCFQRAVDDAVKQVDSAALAQIHGGATPRLASR
jgi:UrcA family protein